MVDTLGESLNINTYKKTFLGGRGILGQIITTRTNTIYMDLGSIFQVLNSHIVILILRHSIGAQKQMVILTDILPDLFEP